MDNEDQDQGAVVNSGFKETLLLLPEEVRFCLEITGYDNEHSLSSLTDVNEIEVFLIEHAKIIKQVEPRKSIKAYGIFYNFCEEFKFKPGHKKMLEELIADLIKKNNIQTSFSNLDVLLDKPDNVWRPTHELGKDTDTETLTTEINLPEGSPAVAQEVSLTDNINSKEEERKLSEKIEENTKVSQDFERNEQVIDVIDQPITKSQTISKKDQWSPLNPEGKRQYDRSFLLQMQFQPLSLRKPEGLPDLEVIKDSVTDWSNKTKPVSLAGFQRSHTPGYVKSCAKPRDAQVKCQSIIEEGLMGVIDLVFEKALDEPNFSIAYTNLCQRLRMKKIPTGNQDNHFVKFREFLLKKCQKEFEGDSPADITKIRTDKEMFTDDKAMKDELSEESDEKLKDLERKEKTRSLGNIRFIGELFELHMLTANIMYDCLKKLVKREDDESFEVLSTMLTTIGTNIDPEKSKSNNNEPRRGINRNSLSPSRDSSKDRGIQMAPSDQHLGKAVVHGRKKKMQFQLVTESRHPAGDNSRESSTTSEEKKDDVALRENPDHSSKRPLLLLCPDLTKKEFKKKARAILDEFLHTSDFQEAILCVSETFASTTISFFVTYAFCYVLRRTAKMRQQIGQLMHDLIKAKVMTPEQYIKGLQAILSLAEGYAIDSPHIWEYLGELIAPLIEDSTLPLVWLHEAAQPCFETGYAGSFVSAVLHAVSKKLGTHEVGELWRSWNLQWAQFLLPSVKTEEFIRKNKLEFTVKSREPCETTSGRYVVGWSRGSSGGSRTSSWEPESKSSAPANRFHALVNEPCARVEDSRRGINRNAPSSSRDSSKGRGTQMAPPAQRSGKAVVQSQKEKEREQAIAAVKTIASGESGRAPIDSSRESSITKEEKKDVALRGNPDLTEIEIEKRAKALLDEFLHNTDFQEAILCISEICAPTTISFFFTYAFNYVLERSAQTRQQIGQLMHDLIKAKVMTPEQYIKGLQAILSLAEDYAIDIPHIWEYLGELIAPLIKDSTLPLSFLHEAAQPCFETGCAGSFVSAVLHAVSNKLGTHEVGELWRSSNLQWSQFLPASLKTEEFIKENKLEFTVKPREPCKTTNLSSGQLKTELAALFASKQSENKEIFDWIDAHLSESQCHEASFVRALMIAVCQSVLGKSDDSTIQVDEALLRNRCNILRKYLDHSEACEMQAIYALQALMHQLEQPKGILCTFFGFLYDEEIISEDAFLLWEKSEDPVEQEGKGEALNSVRAFYVWLKEAENESENEAVADFQNMYPNQQTRLAEHQQRTSANTNTHEMGKQGQSGKPGASNIPMVFETHMPPNESTPSKFLNGLLRMQNIPRGTPTNVGEEYSIQRMYPNQQMRSAVQHQQMSANTNPHDMGKQGQPGMPGASNTPMVFGTHLPPDLQPFYSRQPPLRPQVSSVNQRPEMNMGIKPATATQHQQSFYAGTQKPPPQQQQQKMNPLQQINTMQHMYLTGGGTSKYRIQYPSQQPHQVQSPAQTMNVSTANTPVTHYGGENPPVSYSSMMPRYQVPSLSPSRQPQLPKREKILIRIQDPTPSRDLTE